jgi:hypothetical protein
MLSTDQPEQTGDDGVLPDAKPACMALVPMVQSAQWSEIPSQLSRPNSMFVTQLIATAEQVPQTRSLRRATPLDAYTAYSANPHGAQGTGIRARQIV